MSFSVRFSDRAVKDLQGLPANTQARILQKLDEARADPPRFFRRLTAARCHRLRVSDFRILADIDAKAKTIDVPHVGHRKNVYD